MAKGLFTQGMCVLLRQSLSVERLQELLSSFEFLGTHDSLEDLDSPQTLVYSFRPEVGGHLLITPSNAVWPDDMGDPDESPERFVAWSLGQYGPLAYPGCLKRSGEQSWGWEDGGERFQEHTSHVRILISYVLGAEGPDDDDEDLPLVPDDYDPVEELEFATRAVTAILEADEAICYFNPGGEVLRDSDGLRRGLNYAWNNELPPLDMWTNVRLFRAEDDWSLMDTVGNGQFDLPDLEAIYFADSFEPSDVESFLRSASLYMLSNEDEVEDGDTADGPGDVTWLAMECYDALSDPPRETIRWVPQDGQTPPPELLERGESIDFDDEDDDDDDEDDLLSFDDNDDDDELDEELEF
ncbi:hypothetical protein Pla22_31010 [Rubripirellula amarantea]|uniref:DUF4261 domain-containing protein n=1 Tax=Rubripirellula amarantea TaxID=2527999 RepID=A0A5C5WJP4_9BACT|nr:DUF4261 domain-containing protein [Rubripirellula amarantea]TWT50359.1 hypothetical protein Pla22_31010 [Rubripirellula amarantea]